MIDLSGNKYNRLKVISLSEVKNKRTYWNCLCDCGNNKIVEAQQMKSGKTKSCGCLNIESIVNRNTKHGSSVRGKITPEFRAYYAMKNRCYNKSLAQYKDWGGRGINICDRWLDSFDNFLLDMGKRPSSKHSLDRIDNNKGYFLENCRWATKKEQASNTRRNRLILNIETGVFYDTLVDAANSHGLTRAALEQRIRRNKSLNLIQV